VTAVKGRSDVMVPSEWGFIKVQSDDYLIAASALASAFTEPQSGDQIIDTFSGVERVMEVMPVGEEPCFRYSDPYRKTLRIHCKDVGVNS